MALKLLAIRSAPAEDREAFGLFGDSDDERPLTDQGRRLMAKAATALVEQCGDLEQLAASPLDRGEETGRIVAAAYGGLELLQVPELSPGNPPMAALRWLRSQTEVTNLGIVGHEPELGRFLSWLLVGSDKPLTTLEPGSASLLEFNKDVGAGSAMLRWSLTPAQLCALVERDP